MGSGGRLVVLCGAGAPVVLGPASSDTAAVKGVLVEDVTRVHPLAGWCGGALLVFLLLRSLSAAE